MTTAAKRAYLPADRRRAELLGVAAQIVLGGGWRALTMKGLAERAGVSRQLVYQHFTDQAALLIGLTEHLFERARDATVAIIEGSETADAGALAVRHYEVYLDMPPAQRRVLRAITTEPDVDAPELRRLHRVVRGRMLDLWTPGVRRRTALPPKTARACAWMMTTAAWGLAELVDDGEIPRAQARALLGRVAARVLRPERTTRSRR